MLRWKLEIEAETPDHISVADLQEKIENALRYLNGNLVSDGAAKTKFNVHFMESV